MCEAHLRSSFGFSTITYIKKAYSCPSRERIARYRQHILEKYKVSLRSRKGMISRPLALRLSEIFYFLSSLKNHNSKSAGNSKVGNDNY